MRDMNSCLSEFTRWFDLDETGTTASSLDLLAYDPRSRSFGSEFGDLGVWGGGGILWFRRIRI